MNENLPLILQISLGLLLIFMLVAAYLGSRSWRWYHLTLVVLVFIGSAAFCWLAAFTLRSHQAWRSLYNQYDSAVAQEKATTIELLDGQLSEIKQQNDSLRSLKRELERLKNARGRVWRGGEVTASSPTSAQVNLVSQMGLPAPAEGEGAPLTSPPTARGIDIAKADEKKLIVQVFQEGTLENFGPPDSKLPTLYLGEFMVDTVAAGAAAGEGAEGTQVTLTLKPRLPLDAAQSEALADRNATWALYEIMPVDSHETFTELTPEEFNLLFADARFPLSQSNPEAFAQLKSEYLRTGQEATENDPPERVWRRVRFKESVSVPVDGAVPGEVAALDPFTERYFDTQGLALAPRLRLGGEAKIEPGSTTIAAFPPGKDGADYPAEIEKLINDGVCEPADKPHKVFYRDLRDYRHHFHHLVFRMAELAGEMRHINVDLQRLEAAHALCVKQVAFRQDEQTKLEADEKNVQRDAAALASHLKNVEARLNEVKEKARNTFLANQQLAAELARKQQELADRINAATGPATTPEQPKAPTIPLPSQAF